MAHGDLSMLGAYGEWAAARAAAGPGPLSFGDPRWKSLPRWKIEARAELARCLCAPLDGDGGPARAADVRAHEAYEHDGLAVEELSWQLPWGPRTQAVFLRPRGAAGAGRLPGVLALHDHAGNKYFGRRKIARGAAPVHPMMLRHQQEYYGGRAWANELARRGFAVLVHDVFPFESRKVLASDIPPIAVERMMASPERARELVPADLRGAPPVRRYDVPADEPEAAIAAYNAFAGQHESIVAKSLLCAGTTWPGVTLAEDSAALAYLASRPEVDTARLACGGLSGGGMRSVFLAGSDDRIRCTVVVGFMSTWADFCRTTSYTHTWMLYVPGLPARMDFPDILALHAPSASLVLATSEDPLFTRAETERAAQALAEAYGKAGAADAFRISMYPGPHKFDLPMQEEAFAWFERWLR
jgi:dienelactone hydrolase